MKVFSMEEKVAPKKGSVLDIGKRKVLNRTVSLNELGRTIFNEKDGRWCHCANGYKCGLVRFCWPRSDSVSGDC